MTKQAGMDKPKKIEAERNTKMIPMDIIPLKSKEGNKKIRVV